MNILVILKLAKKHIVLISIAIFSLMWAVIQRLLAAKAKVQRDLAKGESRVLRKAEKSQKKVEEETTSEMLKVEERRSNGVYRDID